MRSSSPSSRPQRRQDAADGGVHLGTADEAPLDEGRQRLPARRPDLSAGGPQRPGMVPVRDGAVASDDADDAGRAEGEGHPGVEDAARRRRRSEAGEDGARRVAGDDELLGAPLGEEAEGSLHPLGEDIGGEGAVGRRAGVAEVQHIDVGRQTGDEAHAADAPVQDAEAGHGKLISRRVAWRKGPLSKASTRARQPMLSTAIFCPGKRLSRYQRYSCSARMGL